jgi:hypothetical protein
MKLSVEVRDHQLDVDEVRIQSLGDWLGPVPTLTHVSGTETWEGEIDNCIGTPPGSYPFRVVARSKDPGTGDDLHLYREVELEVGQLQCEPDAKNTPQGALKIDLQKGYWDWLCPDNPQDYYKIDFTDPGMQDPGGLVGTVRLESCTPGMRVDLVYYDPDPMVYYDGCYVTAPASGEAELRVHIPNSIITGDETEICYIRVRGPVTGAVDAPYHLICDLVYETEECGDPISISTIGAPDIPLAGGMIQGVLCDPAQMDWYRLDTVGPSALPGRITGTLEIEIEYPDPLPNNPKTIVGLCDENGTLLANFDVLLPPPTAPILLESMDLPSLYRYYLAIACPGLAAGDGRAYRIVWQAEIDPTCQPDLINLTNPSPPPINPEPTEWDSFEEPGSCARMWLCDPDDPLDAYPFDIPDEWDVEGKLLGGSIEVRSDSASYDFVQVSLGLQQVPGAGFCWYSPIKLPGPSASFNVRSLWQVPADIEALPLRYWFKVDYVGPETGRATAQLELDLGLTADCSEDNDSYDFPSGSVAPSGTAASFLSPGTDDEDYWTIDWLGGGRLKGDVGVVAGEEVRLRMYVHDQMVVNTSGSSPSINVKAFDLGPGCFGPILKITPIGGDPGQCIQYLVSGVGLNETATCEADPDGNDSLLEIQDKPWLWFSATETFDEICGVVCREGATEDIDYLGIQEFETQGGLFGFVGIDSPQTDYHQLKLVSMDGRMEIVSDNIDSPQAIIELDRYNFPAIPPAGYTYHLVIGPDPSGGDSMSQYNASAFFGINSDPAECPNDGHDLANELESWPLGLENAQLGILCGWGTLDDVDLGLPDLADWFRLDYPQMGGMYISGEIRLTSDQEGITVRLMPEDQLGGTGVGFYTEITPSGGGTATITIPPDTIPSIPSLGDYYYVVVHNNGIGGWTSFALEIDLVQG